MCLHELIIKCKTKQSKANLPLSNQSGRECTNLNMPGVHVWWGRCRAEVNKFEQVYNWSHGTQLPWKTDTTENINFPHSITGENFFKWRLNWHRHEDLVSLTTNYHNQHGVNIFTMKEANKKFVQRSRAVHFVLSCRHILHASGLVQKLLLQKL